MKMLLWLGIMAATGFAVIQPEDKISYPDHFSVDVIPQQEETAVKEFNLNGYLLKPLADFSIEARILSYRKYSNDKEAELSPIDLAVGWGPMSREQILEKINVSQRGRWYFWQTDNFPIPRKEIEQNSANIHMIPADDSIKDRLMKVKVGSIVKFKGQLVECSQSNWKWRSSLTRNDTGDGACEVIYVTSFSIENYSAPSAE